MKSFSFLLACLLLTSAGTFAQSENPRGLYKLQRLGYENGRPDHVPELAQYKYSADFAPVTLIVYKKTDNDYAYSLRQDEPHPYNYTGDKAVGEDGRGTRIYDSNSEHFALKWYNTVRPHEGEIFPMNEFITEYYDRKDIEPQMQRSILMLEQKHEKPSHRFAGCWRMMGNYGVADGERVLMKPQIDLFKVYGEKDVTFLFCSGDRITGAAVFYKPLIVTSESCIKEGDGNECAITWKNDDTFTLKFDRGDGTIVEELWKRSGLPQSFQRLFGTNTPITDVQVPSAF